MKIKSIIRSLSRIPQTRLTLRNLYNFDRYQSEQHLIKSGCFLQKEIPIRLSRRVIELDQLKYGLNNNPHIIYNRNQYLDSTYQILDHSDIENMDDVISFRDLLEDIKRKHNEVVPSMSYGIQSISDRLSSPERLELDHFLDSFYGSRIGIRTIMSQFISVVDHHKGIIRKTKPHDVLEYVMDDVNYMCQQCYPDLDELPKIEFYGDLDYEFTYIPEFLHYIYLEILKNAMQSTIESGNKLINVYQSCGDDDLIVKFEDRGGGFSRSDLSRVYSYSYSSHQGKNNNTNCNDNINNSVNNHKPILSGLGYGVPLSRLYASYFGGHLEIIPYNGIGTDVIVYINKLMDSLEKEY